MPRTFLSILLLTALAAALAYYWDPQSVLEFNESDRQEYLAKKYLINTRTLNYNEQGSLTEIVEASAVRQFPKQKHSLIIAPRYYSHNGNNKTWSVTSDRGRFVEKKEILFLEGNVILTNDQNGGRLNTETMQINLKEKIATSKVPVTITHELSTTSASGMVADLNKEQIRLMPDVESIYAPATP